MEIELSYCSIIIFRVCGTNMDRGMDYPLFEENHLRRKGENASSSVSCQMMRSHHSAEKNPVRSRDKKKLKCDFC